MKFLCLLAFALISSYGLAQESKKIEWTCGYIGVVNEVCTADKNETEKYVKIQIWFGNMKKQIPVESFRKICSGAASEDEFGNLDLFRSEYLGKNGVKPEDAFIENVCRQSAGSKSGKIEKIICESGEYLRVLIACEKPLKKTKKKT